GYNQAALLADFIGRNLTMPVVYALKRKKHSRRQASLDYEERKNNIRDIFSYSGKTKLDSCHILLIDDVLTTGATLDGAARVLLEAGAGSVSVLTLARG
ncbi:MAG: ComF family protein, partial [Verrucomicrobiota bacterium]